MSFAIEFNNHSYRATKENDYILVIRTDISGGSLYQAYDFASRNMFCRSGSSEGGISIVPFSQLDREVLEHLREKLISLKGTPPELPSEPENFSILKKDLTRER